MDQFDAFKAMGEFWARTGMGFLTPPGMGNQAAGFGAFLPAADLGSFAEAQTSLTRAWAAATSLSQTLTASLQEAAGTSDPTAGAVLARIFDPQAWLGGTSDFGAALNRMTEGPQLADLWQNEKRFAALFAWHGNRSVCLDLRVGSALMCSTARTTRRHGGPRSRSSSRSMMRRSSATPICTAS